MHSCEAHALVGSVCALRGVCALLRGMCTRVRCACTRVRHVYSWEVCVHERVPPGQQTLTGWGFEDAGEMCWGRRQGLSD